MRLNGAMLRNARDLKRSATGQIGMTQGDVAEALSMSIATISSAENGNDIRQDTARRLCEFLGIDLAKTVVPRITVPASDGEGDEE